MSNTAFANRTSRRPRSAAHWCSLARDRRLTLTADRAPTRCQLARRACRCATRSGHRTRRQTKRRASRGGKSDRRTVTQHQRRLRRAMRRRQSHAHSPANFARAPDRRRPLHTQLESAVPSQHTRPRSTTEATDRPVRPTLGRVRRVTARATIRVGGAQSRRVSVDEHIRQLEHEPKHEQNHLQYEIEVTTFKFENMSSRSRSKSPAARSKSKSPSRGSTKRSTTTTTTTTTSTAVVVRHGEQTGNSWLLVVHTVVLIAGLVLIWS